MLQMNVLFQVIHLQFFYALDFRFTCNCFLISHWAALVC